MINVNNDYTVVMQSLWTISTQLPKAALLMLLHDGEYMIISREWL